MATTHELSLLSLTHLHTNLTQQQKQKQIQQSQPNKTHQNQDHNHQHTPEGYQLLLNPSPSSSWMWNPNFNKDHHNQHHHLPAPEQGTAPAAVEEESWEVRAFAEDTGSVMGTTWPPRSYTCAFCRREFRSAQALGGHMNVHRRDRARLHQVVVGPHNHGPASLPGPPSSSPSFLSTGPSGFCLRYPPPPAQPSTLLSIYGSPELDRHRQDRHQIRADERHFEPEEFRGGEEVDLELRLGQGPTPS